MRAAKAAGVIAAAAGAAPIGCATYRDPVITVREVSLVDASQEACALRFAIDLENPNDEPLELRRFDYALVLDGKPVFTGRRSAETTLAARGRGTLALPAVVPFERAGWVDGHPPRAAAYTISGRLQYLTPGKIAEALLDLGVRRPSAAFSGKGELLAPPEPPEPPDVPVPLEPAVPGPGA
jgi:hypothetical protein